jgi:hypothetical protein
MWLGAQARFRGMSRPWIMKNARRPFCWVGKIDHLTLAFWRSSSERP